MEIEADDGRKISLKPNTSTIFGRGNKLVPNDLTISRRHVIFELNSQQPNPSRVSFEVIGRNPIWVNRKGEQSDDGQREIKVFKRFERCELDINDQFCLSGKNPVWFKVKRVEDGQGNGREEKEKCGGRGMELGDSLDMDSGFDGDGELGYESVDISNIDPVKEFGFLVIGHEFDQYPKKMIHDIKAWDWFIDDPGKGSTDEEDSKDRGKRRVRRKRKKSKGKNEEDDDDWTTDGTVDEKEVIARARKIRKAEYHTRSKDRGQSRKDTKNEKGSAKKKSAEVKEEDETLGGFIVDNNLVDGVEEEEEEEEEEEFEDDEDDDE